jgi:hypothetical protein
VVLVGTLISMIPAVINGYPLIFFDTGTYIIQALELKGQLDRPPFYSLSILPFHAGISLWPVAVAQALLTVTVLVRFLEHAVGLDEPRLLVTVIAATNAATSFAWFTTLVMPDIHTATIIMLCWLVFSPAVLATRGERIVSILLLGGLVSMHTANVPLTLGLSACAIGLRLMSKQAGPARRVAITAAGVLGVIAVAVVGQMLYSVLVIGKAVPSVMAPLFLLARLIHDGPGRDVLLSRCPDAGWELCALLDHLGTDHNDLLWSAGSAYQQLIRRVGEVAAIAEAQSIVSETVRTYPLRVVGNALMNGARQFVTISSIYRPCPCPAKRIDTVIQTHFAGEWPAYVAALQTTGRFPPDWLDAVNMVVAAVAGAGLVAAAASSRRDRPLIAYVFLALAGNAVLLGGLSGPAERYQARIVWLIPALGFALVARRWQARHAASPARAAA